MAFRLLDSDGTKLNLNINEKSIITKNENHRKSFKTKTAEQASFIEMQGTVSLISKI